MLAQASTVELTHVPYRGVGPALTDVTAGQIPAVALPLGTMVAQSRAGKMRILAHTGTRRSVVSPDIPTFAEQGFPGLQIDGWFGLFAPAGTSAVLVNRYNDIIMKSIRTQAVGERLRALDLDSREYSATEFAAVVASAGVRSSAPRASLPTASSAAPGLIRVRSAPAVFHQGPRGLHPRL